MTRRLGDEIERSIAEDFADFDQRQTKAAKRLGPAKNYRFIYPRCCATCKYHENIMGAGMCLRQDGYSGDEGDLDAFFHVCDLYVKEGER